ncbi:hypothetical protein [Halioxenophilus aromaticivorans]|uniref:Uncharacterized protein n=1 Tax=Halioxenophilus aromaticivorans TaxID=1306992 RepID=A0AAV3TZG9_9ALTE
MAIKITGTIAGFAVDLTLEGVDKRSLVDIAASLGEGISQVKTTSEASLDEQETAPQTPVSTTTMGSEKARQMALAHINVQGEISSCDLINYLSANGISDGAIKRALLLLRQGGEVDTAHADSGQQRIYKSRSV